MGGDMLEMENWRIYKWVLWQVGESSKSDDKEWSYNHWFDEDREGYQNLETKVWLLH